jgi:fucose permease
MRRHARPPVLLAYAAFVLIGLNGGTSGVLLPAQMGDYHVDRAVIGVTFFTGSAGFVLAGFSTGALIHRFGVRISLAVGGGVFVLAGLYLASRPPFVAFALAQLAMGFATGILESALNAYMAALPGATTLLNRLHAFFGVGALLGPVLASWVLGFTQWTAVWLILALCCVPLTAGFLTAYPPLRPAEPEPQATAQEPQTAAQEPQTAAQEPQMAAEGPQATVLEPQTAVLEPRGSGSLLGAALRDRGVLLGATMLAVYVGLELSVGGWGFSYLVQARGLPGSLAGYAVSGYWLGLTLGRFLISPVAVRIGATTAGLMYACLAGVTAAAALAWFSPAAVLTSAALMLLGFFLGPVFPTTMAVAPGLTQARLRPTAIGVMNAGSVVGGAALPWLAGAIAQDTGIWVLLPYAVTLALLQFVVWRSLAARIRR